MGIVGTVVYGMISGSKIDMTNAYKHVAIPVAILVGSAALIGARCWKCAPAANEHPGNSNCDRRGDCSALCTPIDSRALLIRSLQAAYRFDIMAENIHVKLPDGSVKDVPRGTSALDIAKGISPRLADAALAAQIKPLSPNGSGGNGHLPVGESASAAEPAKNSAQLIDLTRPLEQDVELRLLTDRDPEALEVYRHSSAHLMAAAVLELFPETKLGHGPATESGFFYDFYREKPFTPEDLEAIEKKMQELVKQDLPYAREFLPRAEGLERFKSEGDFMKCHFIEQFTAPDEKISIYKTGKFTDFCRGPHIPSTGRIKAFKLLNIAGAYWLGDEKNPQLQRIYGTSFFSKKDLDEYLHKIEEAKKRDHRRAGQAARLVLHPGAGRAGTDLLASQGRHHPQGDGRLDARGVPEARLLAGEHAARGARGPVEDQRPRRLLRAEHVHPDGTGRRRLSHEADELSVPHPDLSRQPEVVSRPAGAAGRDWARSIATSARA